MTIKTTNNLTVINDHSYLDPLVHQHVESRSKFCSLCLENIIRPAYCVSCRNIYCKSCIERWLENASTCPLCKKRWKTNKPEYLFELTLICNLNSDAPGYCIHCLKYLQAQEITSHVDICPWVFRCPDCENYFMKSEKARHIDKCHRNKVSCSGCGQKVMKIYLSEHEKYCDSFSESTQSSSFDEDRLPESKSNLVS